MFEIQSIHLPSSLLASFFLSCVCHPTLYKFPCFWKKNSSSPAPSNHRTIIIASIFIIITTVILFPSIATENANSLCFAIIDQFASITSHLLLHRHFFTLFTLSVSLSLLLSLLPVVPLSPVVTFRRRCSIEGDGQLLQSPQSCSAPSPALLRAPFLLAWDCCPAAS